MSDMDDVEELSVLVNRSRVGDLDAFGHVVRRFQDMAYGYAYSMLGDFHLAEDVAQEAFIEAYRQLASLRDAAAFPGWFRRIVATQCGRATRRKQPPSVGLDAAVAVASEAGPAEAAAGQEMRERVLEAVQSLPEHQRTVTALFYIDGYSQNDIAAFLSVPVTTVKKRLHDSRKRLKERMVDMVEESLKHKAPDERFSQKVIEELLHRPRPLDIEGHPIRKLLAAIREALPDYEFVNGNEIVPRGHVPRPYDMVYHVDESRVLRPDTTVTTLDAMAGRTPPVRLLTAGRVFRPGEGPGRLSVFHQVDVLCVDAGISLDAMKETLQHSIEAVLGPNELQWTPCEYARFEQSSEVAVQDRGKWVGVAGCGMLTAGTLKHGGFDPAAVAGFAFGMGLERLALIQLGLAAVEQLWQPPYVP
jgi:RNA polymerase sigma factor (sigma-70 family)